ncbi:anti-sigma factor domain-containing protein [Sphingomonas sp. MMS24-JH45]
MGDGAVQPGGGGTAGGAGAAPGPDRPAPAPPPVSAPEPLLAVLQPEGAKPFAALYDVGRREVRVAGGVAVPTGRDAELWAIGADGVPRALGLLPRDGAGRVRVAQGLVVAPGVTLAVSIEPVGGSPKATPTGPVVATGALTLI